MNIKDIIKRIQAKTIEMDKSECNWGEGVALWGFNHSLDHVPNEQYLPMLIKWVEKGMNESRFKQTVNTSIPCIGIGEVYKATKNEKYLDFLINQADYLMHDAPRAKNGGIIHSDPYVGQFGSQLWADTVFMAGLFLAYMGRLVDNREYISEAMNQLKLHMSTLQDKDGLLYHAWDESIGKHLGCKWGRANAWMSIGVVELLDYMPKNEEMIECLKKQLDAVALRQSENGLLRTVIDGSFSYYEASSAYGFGYAVLKGIRLGILDKKYYSIVDKMHRTLIENVAKDGTVNRISAGTPVMRNEGEYNIICEHRIQPWGQGLALMYFSEMCKNEE